VVIISACGLLSPAFYGRLAALMARLRSFQREMFREQEKRAKAGPGDQQQLLEILRTQTLQVTGRARLIRRALLFFLTAVAILIVGSPTLVTSWRFPPAAFLAAVLFVAGLISMLGGVISAMLELRESLEQVELEGRFVFLRLSLHCPIPGRIPRKSSPTHRHSKVRAKAGDASYRIALRFNFCFFRRRFVHD
jgi:hypothetical protein